jgi:hypothetical protein
MNTKTFISENGLNLIIKSKKSAIIFEVEGNKDEKKYKFIFEFKPHVFKYLFEYIESEARMCWSGLELKEAYSFSSDYNEYYDKELDSEGYMYIRDNSLEIERPALESVRLYKFDKKKIQSFLYDFHKKLNKIN